MVLPPAGVRSHRSTWIGSPLTSQIVKEGVFVHEHGLCESDDVGPGTRIWAFAHVLAGAKIGRDCNICGGAFVENGAVLGDRVTVKNGVLIWDGVEIGDDCFLGPSAVFTNDPNPRSGLRNGSDHLETTIVKEGATIGANATIVCGIEIGVNAFVGAGSVVRRDVPDHGFMVGNPASRIGWACACGHRLNDDSACSACERTYRLEGRTNYARS